MKKFFKILIAIILVILVYLLSLYFVKNYFSTLNTITFLGNSYTAVEDGQLGKFIPFGEGGFEGFDNRIKYKNIFGLSYYKGDTERNFVYNMTILGVDVFMKDGYIPPKKPTPETVDMLLVYSGLEDTKIQITDKQDIITLVSYFNEANETVEIDFATNENLISIHAISHKDGGVHYITGDIVKNSNKEIYFNTQLEEPIFLPENVQDILNSYF